MIDPTSYICAAVHIDEKFRNQIIEEIFEEEYKAIAISYDLDLVTIVKNCLAARERRERRNFQLALVLFVVILFCLITKDYLLFVLFYVLPFLIVFLEKMKTYELVTQHLVNKSFDTECIKFKNTPALKNRLKEIANEQEGNVIVYGGFSPFVGAGTYINGWSFTINTNKGKKEGERVLKPLPFELNEIHDFIDKSLIGLNLDNLDIEDNLHVNGQQIRDDCRFLRYPLKRPSTIVEPQIIKDFIEKPTHTIRHYKCIRVTDWNGELILLIFLRFVMVGQNLFTEVSYYLLTPLRDYYRQFDNFPRKVSGEKIFEMFIESIFITIFLWILSPFAVWHILQRPRSKRREKKMYERYIEKNSNFNYGAITSLRERVSSGEYQRYFQKLDQEMYLKIIESQIIDSIKKFLENKHIDTSDFEQARSTILNYGVVVSGGSIEANNFTVGKKAKSIITTEGATSTSNQSSIKI